MALRNTLAWGALIVSALAITYTYAPTSGNIELFYPPSL